MAKPSERSQEIENFLTAYTGVDRAATILANMCVDCGSPATEFDGPLSEKEYTASGLCQTCQNGVFTPPDDDDEDFHADSQDDDSTGAEV